ncbi:MAG: haloacid dehalogenase-like hydrolase [Gammaproteobacteria bacterium]
MSTILILDFDSTFVQVETLDVLAELSKDGRTAKKIASLTNAAMQGEISFHEALLARLTCLSLTRQTIVEATKALQSKITQSFERQKAYIQKCASSTYIISGGFKEIILPIVKPFNIFPENVFANTLLYEGDKVCGLDLENPLAHDHGKVKLVKSLSLSQPVHLIGDGYTDYELKAQGLVATFFVLTENVRRQAVIAKADRVINTFEEYIEITHENFIS